MIATRKSFNHDHFPEHSRSLCQLVGSSIVLTSDQQCLYPLKRISDGLGEEDRDIDGSQFMKETEVTEIVVNHKHAYQLIYFPYELTLKCTQNRKPSLDTVVELFYYFPFFLMNYHRTALTPCCFHWGQEICNTGLGNHHFRFACGTIKLPQRQDIVLKSIEFSEEVTGQSSLSWIFLQHLSNGLVEVLAVMFFQLIHEVIFLLFAKLQCVSRIEMIAVSESSRHQDSYANSEDLCLTRIHIWINSFLDRLDVQFFRGCIDLEVPKKESATFDSTIF